jgi:hypothetical protein
MVGAVEVELKGAGEDPTGGERQAGDGNEKGAGTAGSTARWVRRVAAVRVRVRVTATRSLMIVANLLLVQLEPWTGNTMYMSREYIKNMTQPAVSHISGLAAVTALARGCSASFPSLLHSPSPSAPSL